MEFFGETISRTPVTPTALGQARQKIGLSPFEKLHDISCEKHFSLHRELDLHKGYRLYAVDGSSLNLPSTKSLSDVFGRPNSTGKARALPQASFTTLELVNTGWICKYLLSNCDASELAESKTITSELGSGDLLLADRLYFEPAWYEDLSRRKVKYLFRVNSNRYKSLTKDSQDKIAKMRGTGNVDCRVDLRIKRDKGGYGILPNLRYIEIKRPGAQTLYFMTNLDEDEITTLEAGKLYEMRWEIETDFRIFKGQDHLPVVRSKLEDTVRQEVLLRILAHNSVRHIQSQACLAKRQKEPELQSTDTQSKDEKLASVWKPKNETKEMSLRPVDLQFNRAVESTLGLIIDELLFTGQIESCGRWQKFLEKIAEFKVMAKPGRSYPRNGQKYNKGKPNKGNTKKQRKKAKQRKKLVKLEI